MNPFSILDLSSSGIDASPRLFLIQVRSRLRHKLEVIKLGYNLLYGRGQPSTENLYYGICTVMKRRRTGKTQFSMALLCIHCNEMTM